MENLQHKIWQVNYTLTAISINYHINYCLVQWLVSSKDIRTSNTENLAKALVRNSFVSHQYQLVDRPGSKYFLHNANTLWVEINWNFWSKGIPWVVCTGKRSKVQTKCYTVSGLLQGCEMTLDGPTLQLSTAKPFGMEQGKETGLVQQENGREGSFWQCHLYRWINRAAWVSPAEVLSKKEDTKEVQIQA